MDDIFHLQVVLGSILAISLYTCLGSQVSQEKPTLFICTSSPMGFRSTEVVVPNIYIVSNSNRWLSGIFLWVLGISRHQTFIACSRFLVLPSCIPIQFEISTCKRCMHRLLAIDTQCSCDCLYSIHSIVAPRMRTSYQVWSHLTLTFIIKNYVVWSLSPPAPSLYNYANWWRFLLVISPI